MLLTNQNKKGKWMNWKCLTPNKWLVDENLDIYELKLLLYIASWNWNSDKYFTYSYLAKTLNIGVNTVKTRVLSLHRKGYITKTIAKTISGNVVGIRIRVNNTDHNTSRCTDEMQGSGMTDGQDRGPLNGQDGGYSDGQHYYIDNINNNNSMLGKPNPAPKKHRTDKSRQLEVEALKILEYFNELNGRKFKNVPSTLKPIMALLKTYPSEVLRRVVRDRKAKWDQDPKMSVYNRPGTIFRASNFENYVNEPEFISESSKRQAFEQKIHDNLKAQIAPDLWDKLSYPA